MGWPGELTIEATGTRNWVIEIGSLNITYVNYILLFCCWELSKREVLLFSLRWCCLLIWHHSPRMPITLLNRYNSQSSNINNQLSELIPIFKVLKCRILGHVPTNAISKSGSVSCNARTLQIRVNYGYFRDNTYCPMKWNSFIKLSWALGSRTCTSYLTSVASNLQLSSVI